MGAKSQAEIIAFYTDLEVRHHWKVGLFREFLEDLFSKRDFEGCTFTTSHSTFCIQHCYPTYLEWRYKPLLSISRASTANVLFRLRITHTTTPILRAVTESSSCPYKFALDEFDRFYGKLLASHDEEQPNGPDVAK